VTISGSVRFEETAPATLAGLRVRVGDVVVSTDDLGQYSAKVKGIGAVEVTLVERPALAPRPLFHVVVEPGFANVDRLGDTYSADILVHEVYRD
jgi:hypothetical protein